MKISEKIRARIAAAGAPYKANDNISAFIEEGELDLLCQEVEEAIKPVLHSLVIDVDNDHNTRETAHRMAKLYVQEVFEGRYTAQPKATEFPNEKQLDDILIVGDIPIRSTCSHHFAPVLGKAWVGVVPGENVIGISKFSRLIRWIMNRPQIQEEAAVQIVDLLQSIIKPKGIALVMKANHSCMTWRGVKDTDSYMTTMIMRGVFENDDRKRQSFLEMIKS